MNFSRPIIAAVFLTGFNLLGCAPSGTQTQISLETGKQIAADWCSSAIEWRPISRGHA